MTSAFSPKKNWSILLMKQRPTAMRLSADKGRNLSCTSPSWRQRKLPGSNSKGIFLISETWQKCRREKCVWEQKLGLRDSSRTSKPWSSTPSSTSCQSNCFSRVTFSPWRRRGLKWRCSKFLSCSFGQAGGIIPTILRRQLCGSLSGLSILSLSTFISPLSTRLYHHRERSARPAGLHIRMGWCSRCTLTQRYFEL